MILRQIDISNGHSHSIVLQLHMVSESASSYKRVIINVHGDVITYSTLDKFSTYMFGGLNFEIKNEGEFKYMSVIVNAPKECEIKSEIISKVSFGE